MIPWNQAYRRLSENPDFMLLFGNKKFRQDEFRPYSYALRFDSLTPALQGGAATPNTRNLALTVANWGAPTTTAVPGTAQVKLVDFPSGAVVLGITASASLPQANPQRNPGAVTVIFPYAPSEGKGQRELFTVDFEYVDTDAINAGNPISERVSDPNTPVITSPPIIAAAMLAGGSESACPSHELYVAPGLGINVSVRSLVLPSNISATMTGDTPPNMNVHVVFHVMIPGSVSLKRAA